MDFKYNLNYGVKVKLNPIGIRILKEKHDKISEYIKSRTGNVREEFKLVLDEEGYYHTQMWCLMADFGQHISATSNPPFDLNIICCDGSIVEGDKDA